jgi:hypothetical protein
LKLLIEDGTGKARRLVLPSNALTFAYTASLYSEASAVSAFGGCSGSPVAAAMGSGSAGALSGAVADDASGIIGSGIGGAPGGT